MNSTQERYRKQYLFCLCTKTAEFGFFLKFSRLSRFLRLEDGVGAVAYWGIIEGTQKILPLILCLAKQLKEWFDCV